MIAKPAVLLDDSPCIKSDVDDVLHGLLVHILVDPNESGITSLFTNAERRTLDQLVLAPPLPPLQSAREVREDSEYQALDSPPSATTSEQGSDSTEVSIFFAPLQPRRLPDKTHLNKNQFPSSDGQTSTVLAGLLSMKRKAVKRRRQRAEKARLKAEFYEWQTNVNYEDAFAQPRDVQAYINSCLLRAL